MAKISWDVEGQKYYEAGVDQGVLFVKNGEGGKYANGVPWYGLINVEESPSGGEATALWADNRKYGEVMSTEEFAANIEAYYYPDEFEECDGSKEIAPGVFAGQQSRIPFGFTYRTKIGNDTMGENAGYKIHLVYNAKAKPASRANNTINESVEARTLSWECSTTPVAITKIEDAKPTAHLVIDSTKTDANKLKALEELLYGTESKEPTLPSPDEVIELVGVAAAG